MFTKLILIIISWCKTNHSVQLNLMQCCMSIISQLNWKKKLDVKDIIAKIDDI